MSLGLSSFAMAAAAKNVVCPFNTVLNLEGANLSTVFPDTGKDGRTFTASGGAKLVTAQSKFGVSSLDVQNDGDRIDTPYASSDNITGDASIEAFIRVRGFQPSQSDYVMLVNDHGLDTSDCQLGMAVRANRLHAFSTDSVGLKFATSTTVTLLVDTWYHIAAVIEGGVLKNYLDGVQKASIALVGALPDPQVKGIVLGDRYAPTGAANFNGQIDGFAFDNGNALNTGTSYPVPTAYHCA